MIEHDELQELGRASGAHGEVVLRRRGAVTELIVDGVFAMDDVDTSTERALATEALRRCTGDALRVLVGGLGLGWTAATVLADPRVTEADVVELQPALVGWAGEGLLPGLPVLPDRLRLRTADVADALAGSPGRWDAVLLDVDNGPAFLVHETNAGLYAEPGLSTALAALRPGGVLAIWSADPAPELADRLAALPGAADVEHLVLPVDRDGRRFDYAVVVARRAG
ncbi:spermidine synthase [Modestobacter versicolor]|uniref:Spermidine synthase n=1 Tax=Modestobacter versicolor TaxID=429133 RepID=A0A839XV40_9ACTN|nr:spermidine synthase [Modestobacter versicolor]MBB3674908.1 spermidine synthase [Modestobacter versicolor]